VASRSCRAARRRDQRGLKGRAAVSDDLKIPDFLRISAEDRREAWASYYAALAKPISTRPGVVEQTGPGDTCKRLGYTTGINQQFVEALRAQEAAARDAKRAEGLARLAAWKSRAREETAAMSAVKARARRKQKEFLRD
jgi:hypothetical protein